MNKTKTIIAIVVGLIIIGVVWAALKPAAPADTGVATSTDNTAVVVTSTTTASTTVITPTPKPTPKPTPTPVPTPTPTPTPTPAPVPPKPTASGYTLAQVSTHDSATSCWTIVNGNVYDVTAFVSKHPGGSSAIKGMCGRDASTAFNNQHGSQAKANAALANFKIGAFIQ